MAHRRAATESKAKYYVFEMKKRAPGEPLRQVSSGPLPLREARLFARLGARGGKRDQVVTTSPRARKFQLLHRYTAGGTSGTTIRSRKPKRQEEAPEPLAQEDAADTPLDPPEQS